ncbi:MAG: 4-amino-4-deoxy-L-arabinose transferase [Phenylobacterium sp.]|nr:4-amino-4-deoxy-L-arabinose transferase [Phenylobacterium sp.]
MPPTAPAATAVTDPAAADRRAAILLISGLTLVRLITLFSTPLELYPDEAQYWLWSRTLDFGYYSKPPMIAWAIWATTRLGSDAEPWVRLSAPLFQAGAGLLVFAIARRLYGGSAALAATALYALMPAVQLSSLVAATDAPLLFFLGLTIWAWTALQTAEGRARLILAAAVGASLGLAFLAKYAAVYGVIGIALHLAISPKARSRWSPAGVVLAVTAFAVVVAPNLAWNAHHHFATLHHTAANAAWGGRKLFNLSELLEFLAAQFGAFGPIPFAVLIAGGAILAWRRRLTPADMLLICFTLPPLLIVTVQAFVSRANANWSGASYLPGAILVAAWLIRWRGRRTLIAALAIQAAAAAVFLGCVLSPGLADTLHAANSFKRAKGWSEATGLILDRAREDPGLTAIAVNNRFLYYAISYYGRGRLRNPGAPPLRAWLLAPEPQNQAETTAPLTPALGAHVLGVAYEGAWRDEMMADFTAVSGHEIASVYLDRKHKRRLDLFVGEGFAPRPRDPVSGHPTRP